MSNQSTPAFYSRLKKRFGIVYTLIKNIDYNVSYFLF